MTPPPVDVEAGYRPGLYRTSTMSRNAPEPLAETVSAVTLLTADAFPIAATSWIGEGARRGTVLIGPATGAPQRFYQPFAAFLASKGFDVLTWDWRGIGESRHGFSLRDARLRMRAWGEQDLTAAIAWAERRQSAGGIAFVGHSFGGQALGLAPNAALVRRAVFVASQHGWLGNWPLYKRPALALFFHLAMPLAARILGRFPSSRVGLGEDLPEGVALEWARWCRSRDYHGTWTGHARLEIPLFLMSFDDDPIAPERAAAALLLKYPKARTRHTHRSAEGLGHFGFFRAGRAPALWDEVAAFLLEGDAP